MTVSAIHRYMQLKRNHNDLYTDLWYHVYASLLNVTEKQNGNQI